MTLIELLELTDGEKGCIGLLLYGIAMTAIYVGILYFTLIKDKEDYNEIQNISIS